MARPTGAEPAAAEPDAPHLPEGGQSSGAGPLVLVVEDNEINRRVASGMLERLGCRVELACDGAEAVERVRTGSYDIIFMDCQMPVMDGFDATTVIRAQEVARRTPILALTASALRSDAERCLQVGMDGHLTKPVTSVKLRAALDSWVPSPAGGAAPAPEEPAVGADSGALDDAMIQELRDLGVDEDGSLAVRPMLEKYLTSAAAHVVALGEALRAGDSAGARANAHTLRGSSLSFGARQLGELAGQIEHLVVVGRLEEAAVRYEEVSAAMDLAAEALTTALGTRG